MDNAGNTSVQDLSGHTVSRIPERATTPLATSEAKPPPLPSTPVIVAVQASPAVPPPPEPPGILPPIPQRPIQNASYRGLPIPLVAPFYGYEKDNGSAWGFWVFVNHCATAINLWSVGVFNLHGPRESGDPMGTDEELVKHSIAPGGMYAESIRVTCPRINNNKETVYCAPEDKLAGQGVAFKLAWTDLPDRDIVQVEYALVKDPERGGPPGDPFHRLNYDVSLLDCGSRENISDFNATTEQIMKKAEACPGFQDGLSVTFDNDTQTRNCPPTFCDGVTNCLMAYLWDRTRKGESSLSCEAPYIGNVTVDLCVGNAPDKKVFAAASGMQDQWIATANNLPLGVTKKDGSKPTSLVLGALPIATSLPPPPPLPNNTLLLTSTSPPVPSIQPSPGQPKAPPLFYGQVRRAHVQTLMSTLLTLPTNSRSSRELNGFHGETILPIPRGTRLNLAIDYLMPEPEPTQGPKGEIVERELEGGQKCTTTTVTVTNTPIFSG